MTSRGYYAVWTFVSATLLPSLLIDARGAALDRAARWSQIAPFFSPPAEYFGDYGKYKSPLVFDDGTSVRSADNWQRRRSEILSGWNKIVAQWPALIEQPRVEYLEVEARENFVQHRVRVEIARGQHEAGYLLIPGGDGPFPAIVVPFYEPETSIGKNGELRDFGYQLARRGFVTLSIGSPGGDARKPEIGEAVCQPLAFLGYVAANCYNLLANLPNVDSRRIGIVGHSYGGKWAMFGSCFYEKYACAVWSDPGIVFDELRPNVNYWEPWYLGLDAHAARKPGLPTETNPRTGAYRTLVEAGFDLHEVHALMAPRPFLVSGGSEDQPERWRALNHSVAVNRLLGYTNRVAMTNRKAHSPTVESNDQIYSFFEHFLKE
ncbi:MAG: alpha/beta hydrolase [Verrucomicrobia bacterium]|nr:alpha/beta hydrolase [Verrucomicrobiota bacterium]